MHTHADTCRHTRRHTDTYMYTHTHMYTHAHTYTYTHRYMQSRAHTCRHTHKGTSPSPPDTKASSFRLSVLCSHLYLPPSGLTFLMADTILSASVSPAPRTVRAHVRVCGTVCSVSTRCSLSLSQHMLTGLCPASPKGSDGDPWWRGLSGSAHTRRTKETLVRGYRATQDRPGRFAQWGLDRWLPISQHLLQAPEVGPVLNKLSSFRPSAPQPVLCIHLLILPMQGIELTSCNPQGTGEFQLTSRPPVSGSQTQ